MQRSVLRGGCSPVLAGMCSRESRTTAPGIARADLHPCNTLPWSFADAVVICSPQTSFQAPDAIQALVLRFGMADSVDARRDEGLATAKWRGPTRSDRLPV